MAKKRVSRKEIKQPDEFVSFWMKVYEYAQLHRRRVIAGISAVVAVLVLIWAGIAYSEKRERDASRLFSKAQMALIASHEESSEKSKEQAEEILTDLVQRYSRTHAAQGARALLGNIYYQRREFEKSIEMYEALAQSKPKNLTLRAMADEGVAYSYEQKGEWDKALTYYERLALSPLERFSQEGLWGVARCYEMQHKLDQALETYRKFLATYPHSSKAQEARSVIARLSEAGAHSEAATSEAGASEKEAGQPAP